MKTVFTIFIIIALVLLIGALYAAHTTIALRMLHKSETAAEAGMAMFSEEDRTRNRRMRRVRIVWWQRITGDLVLATLLFSLLAMIFS